METRRTKEVESAVKFLEQCTLTKETYDHSAVAEIRRQLEQGLALVYGARGLLERREALQGSTELVLLDMAEDELSDLAYIDRLDGGAA